MNVREQFLQLSSLLRLYLAQEYTTGHRVYSERESFEYFKTYALSKREAPKTDIKTPPTPIVPPSPKPSPIAKVEPPPAKPNERKSEPTPAVKKEVVAESPKKETSDKGLHLEPLGKAEPQDLTFIGKSLTELFPEIKWMDRLPNDEEAKAKRFIWNKAQLPASVVILSFNEEPKQITFLSNLCLAIELYGKSCKIVSAPKIEAEGEWDKLLNEPELRLVLASDYAIYAHPELLKRHREMAKETKRFLNKIPLFLLSDLTFYLKEPSLKASLWKALKELL